MTVGTRIRGEYAALKPPIDSTRILAAIELRSCRYCCQSGAAMTRVAHPIPKAIAAARHLRSARSGIAA